MNDQVFIDTIKALTTQMQTQSDANAALTTQLKAQGDLIASLMARLDANALPMVAPDASWAATFNNKIARQMPVLTSINNLELTFFDNKYKVKKEGSRGGGSTQYVMKVEVNLTAQKLSEARDIETNVDLFPLDMFVEKLLGRSISPAYRVALQDVIGHHSKHPETIMMGMFTARGGKAGQVWHENQFMVVKHQANVIEDVEVFITDNMIVVDGWKTKQKNGQSFALPQIKSKAYCWPADQLKKPAPIFQSPDM